MTKMKIWIIAMLVLLLVMVCFKQAQADTLMPRDSWVVLFESPYNTGEDFKKALDGLSTTIWHTRYSPSTTPFPHEVHIDLGSSQEIKSFHVLNRNDGSTNGFIKNFEFYVSDSASSWGAAAVTGTLISTTASQTVTLPTPKTGRYIRLVSLSTINGKVYSSMAEFNITVTQNDLVGQSNTFSGTTLSLSSEGTSDWVHWGLASATSINRKSGVTPQISNFTKLGGGTVGRFIDARMAYSWIDGTPTTSVTGSTTGIYVGGTGMGFRVSAPADTTTRVLKMYVGVYNANGTLTASIVGAGTPAYTTTFSTTSGNADRVITLTYKASTPTTLQVDFTGTTSITGGNIALQAATLSGAVAPVDPPVRIGQENWIASYVDSEETAYGDFSAEKAFDGLAETSWITQWTGDSPAHPHEVHVDLFDSYTVHQVHILPRQGTTITGRIKDYAIFVSMDNTSWGSSVASGVFPASGDEQTVTLNTPKTGKFVAVMAYSALDGGPYTAVAELNLTGVMVTPREEFSHGDLKVTISLSTDVRATSHTLYLRNMESGVETSYPMAMNTQYIIPALDILPNIEYAVTATASGLCDGNVCESARSNAHRFKMIDAIVAPQYTITALAGSGGTITPSGDVVVNEGADMTFTITPDAGQEIDYVAVDGVSVGVITSYVFNAISADHTISAWFKPIPITTHVIAAGAGIGGTISPAGNIVVNEGDNQTFTITPDAGAQIAAVVVDGANMGVISSYTFMNVIGSHSIEALFEAIPEVSYTIDASAGTGGSISPSGAVVVVSGANQTFTITPGTGYEIQDVKVNNVSVGKVDTYTFTNVTTNHTIQVTFNALPTEYIIDIVYNSGGYVQPSGWLVVNPGANVTLDIVPNTCYFIEDVVVDGVSIGSVVQVTFTNVMANHTVDVTFTACDPIAPPQVMSVTD